ncbi:MAG: peptide deformylase [Parcubacteria group bacterium]|nr:peptide deformylase [Parcubacteria group bacterium]MCR4342844.1 peptide deformylase [Patescibacteria group bacterium]
MRDVVQKENKVLREKARELKPEEIKSDKIKKLLKRMSETLIDYDEGVALAAPQVAESLRIFIVSGRFFNLDMKLKDEEEADQPKTKDIVFINPKITKMSKRQSIIPEGCLSVESVQGEIKRSDKVTVEALDENGKKFTRGASGLLAQIIQHEVDHLNGILFIDSAKNLKKIDYGK